MRAASTLLLLAVAAGAFTIDVKNALARQVVVELGLKSRADIRLDIAFGDTRITLKTDDLPVRSCLEKLAEACGGELFVLNARDYHIVPGWKHALLGKLHGKKITLDYERESAKKLVQVIATDGGLDFAIDPAFADFKARLVVQDMTLVQALDTLLAQGKAAYDLRYGVVFVASRKRLAALPKRMPLVTPPRLEKQRFRIDSHRRAASEILADIARQAGLTPKIETQLQPALKRNLTLRLRDAPIGHPLAAILVPANARAEIRGDTLIVTGATR